MSNIEVEQIFSFDVPAPAASQKVHVAPLHNPMGADHATMHLSLEAAGQAAYHWAIADDQITWSNNASEILLCRNDAICTGKRFALVEYTAAQRSCYRRRIVAGYDFIGKS